MSYENVKYSKILAVLCVLFVLFVLSACGGAGGSGDDDEVEPPLLPFSYREPADIGDGWSTADAADLGVDVNMLEAMMDALPARFDIVDSLAIA